MKRKMIAAVLLFLVLNSLAPVGSLLAAEPVDAGLNPLPEFLSELLQGDTDQEHPLYLPQIMYGLTA